MQNSHRLHIVDSLRGFALMGVLFLLFASHFDLSGSYQTGSEFHTESHREIFQVIYYLFGGKASALFALIFGFGFFSQFFNYERQGIGYRRRYLWRMVLLFFIGFIISLFFRGDVISYYALFGFVFVLFQRFSSKTLIFLAILFAIQISLIYNLVLSFVLKDFNYNLDIGGNLVYQADQIYTNGSFFDVLSFNLSHGKVIALNSVLENGNLFKFLSLFIVGILIGRINLFTELQKHQGLHVKLLIMGVLLVAMFGFLYKSIMISEFSDTQKFFIASIINSYSDIIFTLALILGFILMYLKFRHLEIFNLWSEFGQMSLTNYVLQIIIGVLFFYGFGMNMHKSVGIAMSLLFGAFLFSIQLFVSKIWLRYFYYGPLEWLWRALTFFNFSLKFKRDKTKNLVATF